MRKKIGIIFLLMMTFGFIGCGSKEVAEVKEINISVAASLTDPINEIIQEYSSNKDNIKINVNSGGSGTLKKQISQGADVGVFFTADEKYIDELIDEGFVNKEDKVNPITNKLILIKSNSSNKNIESLSNLVDADLTIALGDFNTVPVGAYSKEALENEKIWDSIQDEIIYGNSVKAVRSYVERGEVDCGIIYKSDANRLENSTVEIEIPDNMHKKIVYSIAPIKGYVYEDECKDLISFINSDKSKEIFKKYGFSVME